MSTYNENTMIPDQDAVKSLRELTASVLDLCSIIRSEHSSSHPDKSREELKAKDAIVNTLNEQISKGRPEKIPDWAKVELMPVDEIEMENKQFTQKYEGFWKDIDEPTQLEKEAAVQAYTSAFSRFQEIYRLIGWRDRDDEDCMQADIYHQYLWSRQIVRVLALTARTLKGGHLASSLSLETLLHLCYARQILDQPGVSDVDTYRKQFELLYDCLTALDFTRKFREIREPLCELFYLRYKSESIREVFDRVRISEEDTIGIERYPELPLEENTDSTFHPEIFTIPYLQRFGRLNIEWTDCLDEHLKIYANRNSIRVFAHPTFFYNGIDLHKAKRDYHKSTYLELSRTYGLLFRPTSSRNIQRLRQSITAGEDDQILWYNSMTFNGRPIHRLKPYLEKEVPTNPKKIMDIDPVRYPTKDILSESFYRCSLPPSIQVAFDIANPFRAVKRIAKRWDQHTVTSTSMQQIFDLAPNYPEDLRFMITSVMENSFADTESFVRFPYFEPRLRRLKMYLDSREPSTIRELWYDRRDYRSWCMFWGAGFFGVCVLLLIFVILLVQLACI
ncbi:hypothetical protein TMatcc_004949 [Talaromyces marneffei ATCC 18224]